MALSIYQNLYSLSSQRYLGVNQSGLGKSIERLSSGLRINHASDDASGLAISEKMRGQISGLKRARMNAQDGISYLQTAEGAMEQSSSILQRMRELAVQASNGTYTTNDRLEIQKEVDQLKDELNRISTSTEFNTRKLINGDGTAVWSSDSPLLSAIVRSPAQEGNYEIQMSVRPGTNQIQKSNIFTLRDGAIGAEMSSANTTNVVSVSNPSGLSSTTQTGAIPVTVTSASLTAAATTVAGIFSQSGSSWTYGSTTAAATNVNATGKSGYIEIEILQDHSTADLTGVSYRARFIDAATGTVGAWENVTNTLTGSLTHTFTVDGAGIQFGVDITNNKMQKGDKLLLTTSSMDTDPAVAAGGTDLAISGGGTIKLGNGPTITYSSKGTLTPADNGDGLVDTKAVTVYLAEMDAKTGNVNIGNITLNFKETPVDTTGTPSGDGGVTVAGTFNLSILGSGEAATTTTKLKDLAQFTDSDGTNIFDIKQELTIYGNGTSVVVHLEGNDTIATVIDKLNNAIVSKLGMGSDDSQANANLARFVSIPDSTGWGTIKGTMLIQTALTGSQGELHFIGDQRLIDGLGFAQVQQSSNNESTVTIRDAHTGNLIGTETTGDDRIYTLIDGMEVVLDSRAGVVGKWDQTTNSMKFTSNDTLANTKMHLHVVDTRTSLQIGANKGQDLNVSIPQLDVEGLGLENTTMVTQDLAQNAISQIDRALTMVVSARATVGAQVSRLEYTIQNLDTARENLVTSESRIMDLDVAEESANFANAQVLVQSGIAMLAQANQMPQMALSLIRGS